MSHHAYTELSIIKLIFSMADLQCKIYFRCFIAFRHLIMQFHIMAVVVPKFNVRETTIDFEPCQYNVFFSYLVITHRVILQISTTIAIHISLLIPIHQHVFLFYLDLIRVSKINDSLPLMNRLKEKRIKFNTLQQLHINFNLELVVRENYAIRIVWFLVTSSDTGKKECVQTYSIYLWSISIYDDLSCSYSHVLIISHWNILFDQSFLDRIIFCTEIVIYMLSFCSLDLANILWEMHTSVLSLITKYGICCYIKYADHVTMTDYTVAVTK